MIRLVYRRGSWFWRAKGACWMSIHGPYTTARGACLDAYQLGNLW